MANSDPFPQGCRALREKEERDRKEATEQEDDGCPQLVPFPENLPHARSLTTLPGRGSPKLTTSKVCGVNDIMDNVISAVTLREKLAVETTF